MFSFYLQLRLSFFFWLRCVRSVSMSRSNCSWSLMISCNFFSLCDHDSFSSSLIPSILRLFLRLRFSKSFSLSLISFKSGITGCFCCCWCFWFCSNSLFRLSRVLKFSSHWSVWNCRDFFGSGTSFFNTAFSPSHYFFCPFVQVSSWKSLLLILMNLQDIFNLIYSKSFLVPMMNF